VDTVVAWFGATFSGLDWLPIIPSDIPSIYLALGCVVAIAALMLVLTVLVQRRKRRLLNHQIVLLHWEIDELKSRIIALEVAERRRRKDASRIVGEMQETSDRNVLSLFPPRSNDGPPLQPDAPMAPQRGDHR
jgi:hypothetical protein